MTRPTLWLGIMVASTLVVLLLVHSLAADDPASADDPGQAVGQEKPVARTARPSERAAAPAESTASKKAIRRAAGRSFEPQQLTVAFAAGTDIVLTARPLRESSIIRPERLGDTYTELVRLAQQGDASAAYSLHGWLTECIDIPRNAAELSEAVGRLHRDRSILDDRGKPFPITNIATHELGLRSAFAFCEGAPRVTRQQADAWLERAVSTGAGFALSAKALQTLLRAPREAFPAYHELWEKYGDVGALPALAFLHDKGLTGADKDLVQAYAYKFASFKVHESVYGGSVFPSHRNMLSGMEDALRVSASYLTPEQTLEAERRGRQLLLDNPNCCTGLLFGSTTEKQKAHSARP